MACPFSSQFIRNLCQNKETTNACLQYGREDESGRNSNPAFYFFRPFFTRSCLECLRLKYTYLNKYCRGLHISWVKKTIMQKNHTEDHYLRIEAYLAFERPDPYLTLARQHPDKYLPPFKQSCFRLWTQTGHNIDLIFLAPFSQSLPSLLRALWET